MSAFSFRRLCAVLLLTVFSLGLAGQALAAVTVTVPIGPAAAPVKMVMHDSGAVMHCAACDRANGAATMPNCPAAPFCWALTALPAQAIRAVRVAVVAFAPPAIDVVRGIAVRPEPHPPRFPAIV